MKFRNSIKKLIEILNDSNINELEVTTFWGFRKIRLSKKVEAYTTKNTPSTTQFVKPKEENLIINDKPDSTIKKDNVEPTKEEPDSIQKNYNEENLVYQKAPLVGTFYNSPKPGDPPFVKIGDKISKGQTLCIIEAMKIFNEIESEHDGIIVEELIEDSNPVEFNQSIYSIDPS